jgi:hypothetical protein
MVHAPPFQYPLFDLTTDTVKPAYNGTARDLIFAVAKQLPFHADP